MKPAPLLVVLLPLLFGGCGEKSSSEGSESASENPTAPSEEVKTVEEKQQEVKEEVKPEESVAETKPAEAVSVSPHLKYETEGDAVTITYCYKKASGALIIPATIEGKSVTSIGDSAFGFTSLTAVTFLGDAPKVARDAFAASTPTIYRKPEAKGWGKTFGGRPVKLISEKP